VHSHTRWRQLTITDPLVERNDAAWTRGGLADNIVSQTVAEPRAFFEGVGVCGGGDVPAMSLVRT
jgi:hypothetical protein